MTSPLSLKIVVGSTREGRQADAVVPWVVERAVDHGAFDVELLDLRAYRLPMFGEDSPGSAVLEDFNRVIGEGDVFAFVTPEYNHSVSGVLKNAIDSVFGAFRNKAAGFVGYSAGVVGGARAVEHLAQIVVEREMVPLRNAVLVAQVQHAFRDGSPTDPASDTALGILLDDLVWWGEALRRARAHGELPPAGARRVAA